MESDREIKNYMEILIQLTFSGPNHSSSATVFSRYPNKKILCFLERLAQVGLIEERRRVGKISRESNGRSASEDSVNGIADDLDHLAGVSNQPWPEK